MKKFQQMMPIISVMVVSFAGTFYFMRIYGESLSDLVKRDGLFFVWMSALLLLLSAFSHIFLHELGHLVFGLCTGYRFLSFRIGNLVLMKKQGKFRLKKFLIPGTLGQCLLSPPPLRDGKIPYLMYNSGGLIFTLLWSVCGWFMMRISGGYFLLFGFLTMILGIALFFINIIPMKNIGVNDGNNIFEMMKDVRNQEIFRRILLINEYHLDGYYLKDMPDEWFERPSGDLLSYQLPISLYHAIFSRQMENQLFEQTYDDLKNFLNENSINPVMALLMRVDLLFLLLILEKNDAVDALCDSNFLKNMRKLKSLPAVNRSLYAYYLLHQRNEKMASSVLSDFEKSVAYFPYEKEVAYNRELMDCAKNLWRKKSVSA